MPSDIEIAQAFKDKMRPIIDLAGEKLSIPAKDLDPYGHFKAKLSLEYIKSLESKPDGKLILVTAISPTPAGEGKSTTTVGLSDGLNAIGKTAIAALREPSLGPCFGMKGGATGGGHAQVVPMEDINLHFTGDFHAIAAAHNLLAAMVDNHVHQGNDLNIDTRLIQYKRVVDMNDRALRKITIGMGGTGNGFMREDGYDIVVASEVMAILCLATDLADLKDRLGKIVIGYTQGEPKSRKAVTAADLKAHGAMAVLLKDAMKPNMVQTLEGNIALIHGGPFANIAHGCNTVLATKTALKMADYVVTEAGFGADLGAEKFLDIKCRMAGLKPSAVCLVTTVKALKHHGGVGADGYKVENVDALTKGFANLDRHLNNISQQYGLPVVVSVNHFYHDTDAEIKCVMDHVAELGHTAVLAKHWADGAKGAKDLAEKIVAAAEKNPAGNFKFQYPDESPLIDKIRAVCQNVYGAADIEADQPIKNKLAKWDKEYPGFPVCIAKTQMSFSTDPTKRGAPSGHVVTVREVRINAGARFVVAVCGDIMTMPGLPKVPAAESIDVDADGVISGLF
jgi:formate--tetrahydrofolate ligase